VNDGPIRLNEGHRAAVGFGGRLVTLAVATITQTAILTVNCVYVGWKENDELSPAIS